MNSLAILLENLGSEIGLELEYAQKKSEMGGLVEISFSALPSNRSFRFQLSRSWKTTKITFVPDPFAKDLIGLLVEQSEIRESQVEQKISEARKLFSKVAFQADRGSSQQGEGDSSDCTFRFEVEALTSESAIDHGLLNQKEEELIVFVVQFVSSLLPLKNVTFRSPDEAVGFPEGAKTRVFVNRYERDPRNRAAAIDLHGSACSVCGFSFEEFYGSLGTGYVVVHHVIPASKLGPDYIVNPSTDLVTLCANCHAMVHREDPPLSVDELRRMLFTD